MLAISLQKTFSTFSTHSPLDVIAKYLSKILPNEWPIVSALFHTFSSSHTFTCTTHQFSFIWWVCCTFTYVCVCLCASSIQSHKIHSDFGPYYRRHVAHSPKVIIASSYANTLFITLYFTFHYISLFLLGLIRVCFVYYALVLHGHAHVHPP